ncbi:MAG: hypothetical protein MJ108_05355 [Saccharofermentans sp.]|nr:hypothetical protein [Saccharofermentans sp.]
MSLLKKLFDEILPCSCIICRKLGVSHDALPFSMPENLYLCNDCLSHLVPVDKDRRWLLCLSEPYDGDPHPGLALYMPFAYDDFFGKAIPEIKFKYNQDLAQFLGDLLGNIMRGDNISADVVIPVPLSEIRLKERGFNQAGVIGRRVASLLEIAFEDKVLIRNRNTQRQTGIKENSERSSNVNGAFSTVDCCRIMGKTVILIDDVATTGHTLHEAACVLLREGASKVLCVALCGNRSVKNADPY